MTDFLVLLFSFVAGIVGGMGMGGGTVLIPLLSMLNIPLHVITSINLIAFVPMSIMAVWLHGKNGLLRPDNTGVLIIAALGASIVGAALSQVTEPNILKKIFGVFYILFGLYEALAVYVDSGKKYIK